MEIAILYGITILWYISGTMQRYCTFLLKETLGKISPSLEDDEKEFKEMGLFLARFGVIFPGIVAILLVCYPLIYIFKALDYIRIKLTGAN